MSNLIHRTEALTSLTALADRVENLSIAISDQAVLMEQSRFLYHDLLANLRETIGDLQKATNEMQVASMSAAKEELIRALVPVDINEKDALGSLLLGHSNSSPSRILRKRLQDRFGLVLFPSVTTAPAGFDGKRGMMWQENDTRELMDYRLYSLVEGGVPVGNVPYRVIELGWLALVNDGNKSLIRKALVERKREETTPEQSDASPPEVVNGKS
ncbi:MAG: hypothetical protein JW384_02982 [Nitrosomonadaceae bacterium]|nr:hypothetical protein [Nitrosomonadaceae bacterium]